MNTRTAVLAPPPSPPEGGRPAASRVRVGLAAVGLLLYGGVVLLATMWPTPLDRGYAASIRRFLGVLHDNGIPYWFGYSKLEFSANVLMFVPLGFLLALAIPRRMLWACVVIIPVFSAGIELAQGAFLAERFASVYDVAANTAGGCIGAIAAMLLRAAVDRRDQKVVARALWDRGIR